MADSDPGGFTVKTTLEIAKSPGFVYNTLVEGVGSWWNSGHTFSGDAKNLSIQDKPGGCLCEKLSTRGGLVHLTVVYSDPGKLLRFSGSLGPLQQLAASGSMTFSFEETPQGTKLDFVYTVSGYRPGGMAEWAAPVDSVLMEQLARLKKYAETGAAE